MSRSRCAPVIVLSALCAVGLLAVGAAPAAKVTNVKSSVTITAGKGTEFKGRVTAANKKCRKGRKVKLFKEMGSEDELVGTAKTNASGVWLMPGSYLAAIYHAEVARMVIQTDSGRLNCLFAISMSARY
jgi:hypothetical protein